MSTYSIQSYKTIQPYSKWYMAFEELKKHIKERCVEITSKCEQKHKEFIKYSEEEYRKGEDYGKSFDLHNDPTYEIGIYRNNELVSLEAEIKSTLEKELNDIAVFCRIRLKNMRGSSIEGNVKKICKAKQIDMSDSNIEWSIILKMKEKRNESEHSLDNAYRDISFEYIDEILENTCNYMNKFIQRLHENRNT